MLSRINNPSGQNFPKFAILSVKISFLTNKNKIFGISVVFYTGKFLIKSLLYFQFLFIERAVNTLVVLILNHILYIFRSLSPPKRSNRDSQKREPYHLKINHFLFLNNTANRTVLKCKIVFRFKDKYNNTFYFPFKRKTFF